MIKTHLNILNVLSGEDYRILMKYSLFVSKRSADVEITDTTVEVEECSVVWHFLFSDLVESFHEVCCNLLGSLLDIGRGEADYIA